MEQKARKRNIFDVVPYACAVGFVLVTLYAFYQCYNSIRTGWKHSEEHHEAEPNAVPKRYRVTVVP